MVHGASGKTVRLTVAQAIVRYITAQHSVVDGVRQRFIPAALGIFGHGNVAGLGQAFAADLDQLPFIQGRNEQSLGHIAVGYAKAAKRRQALAVTASIGPGATNTLTAAGLATVNRLPLLLLLGDTYATRRQGPVLQQLENPAAPDTTVNDAFRPVSRFFDRISRPEHLMTALPQAFRVLANPVETGAVVLSLPQDVQSHAHDWPVEMFEPRDWKIRRPLPDPAEISAVAELIRQAERPLVIAGGGVIYSDAQREITDLGRATELPISETFGGKGAVLEPGPFQVGGVGLEGTPATNRLARHADLIVHVGTRLTDFATASQSLFAADARFASVNISEFDAIKEGAVATVADAQLALRALADELRDYRIPAAWRDEVAREQDAWAPRRAAALDPDRAFVRADHPDAPVTNAVITQGQLIGVLQEHARSGDTIIAAAGSPPGDLQKVWDATDGRHAHLEFGFSCMGYELPAAIGVRLADPNPEHRVTAFIGDGTFLMQPTEIVTAAAEGIGFTLVVSENHGFQVIRRLQMGKTGRHFANEFRYRDESGAPLHQAVTEVGETTPGRLEGDYLKIDLVEIAHGLGAETHYVETADEFRAALDSTRGATHPVVIVVATVPQVDLPGAEVWWDVSPAEVSGDPVVDELYDEYLAGRADQKWHG
ncbi:3D-(3,5/4)-trihydroxycyclohexane-1,2-dione acylhydrolase (decyclizing) [Pseudoclavibacter sp. 13-3]|uniref:3D-(3,5/4)-trihydroxycyclohexane-1,2-dione acylhydrolase (decyclizing) n=1 Tax=Pseudoclavibacter sp. 13-3 TaxID=2901228 RepID=UPI001E435309|nr:3D-(3,5/4)-trihydroxycyclohexane-1,2-dione acylhydrolase (decyclizing) [Pseudoclavibacter sp. 13-3]MCD7101570.1 3D-(3,5/4)-trihydroxycyclohexane-1,2-dione acylhydrolase (decyclizing) [Pseudoclavibacter sp. 13-3]